MAENLCSSDSCGWLLAGNLYFGLSENSTTFRHVGEADKFAVTLATEKKSFPSKNPATYGQDACATYVAQATEISVTLRSTNIENLRLAFLGESSDISIPSGSVASESITAANDSCVFLPHRNLSNVVLTDEAELVTYAVDTDYSISAKTGIIKTLSTGSIVDESVLKINYDYAAKSGFRVQGAVLGSVTLPIRLVGQNLANGKEIEFFAPAAVLTSNTEIDMLQDDFLSIELTGTLQLGSDGTLFHIDQVSYT